MMYGVTSFSNPNLEKYKPITEQFLRGLVSCHGMTLSHLHLFNVPTPHSFLHMLANAIPNLEVLTLSSTVWPSGTSSMTPSLPRLRALNITRYDLGQVLLLHEFQGTTYDAGPVFPQLHSL